MSTHFYPRTFLRYNKVSTKLNSKIIEVEYSEYSIGSQHN